MGDVYCAKCGEPWDYWGIKEALEGRDGDMTKEEAERFMKGEGCPACNFGQKCPTCEYAKKYNDGKYMCPNPECGFATDIGYVLEWDSENKRFVKKICPICKGKGYVEICPVCGGTGKPNRKDGLIKFLESVLENTDEDPMIYFELIMSQF